jgi:Uri superfamily endonuclease
LLLLSLAQPARISVGRLGTFRFPAGHYTYAGSALGPGGLSARLGRHARVEKRLHWHVDYLIQHAVLECAWQIAHPERLECAWASAMRGLPGAQMPVPGFGASDCHCPAHLVLLPDWPSERRILDALYGVSPANAHICCLPIGGACRPTRAGH